jgi:hypothetical protein
VAAAATADNVRYPHGDLLAQKVISDIGRSLPIPRRYPVCCTSLVGLVFARITRSTAMLRRRSACAGGSINPDVPRTRSTLMLRLQYPGRNRQQTERIERRQCWPDGVTRMTMMTRWTLTVGLACACGLAGAGNAKADDRLLRLLQLQTLNRMAPHGAPTKKDASGDNSARQDRAADRPEAQPQPDNRGAPRNVPAGKP